MVLRLVPLPVSTFGEIEALELEAMSGACAANARDLSRSTRRRCMRRTFAGARFGCAHTLWDGSTCNAGGYLTVRPASLLPPGQDVGMADIY
jgi:hypothetical protein